MPNKRGSASEGPLINNIAYLILFLVFLGFFFVFASVQKSGAGSLEDFYAKEIVGIIDSVDAGTVSLDVTKGVAVALENGVSEEDIFIFSDDGKVTVSLRQNGGTTFNFFRKVKIVDPEVKFVSGGKDTTRLVFKIEGLENG